MRALERMPSEQTEMIRRQAALSETYKRVFAGPDGERVLNDLLRDCGLLSNCLDPDKPALTAYAEGRRSVALDIIKKMRWSEEHVMALAMRRVETEV